MRAIFSTVVLLLIAVGSGRAADLQILLPLYSYPNWYAGAAVYQWDDVAAAASQVPITAIINPNSGPNGGPPNSDYIHGMGDLSAAGVKMVGYVSTRYGNTTERSLAAIKADVDLYENEFSTYGVSGIFLDEVSNDPAKLAHYSEIYSYIKTKPHLTTVIGNPGTKIPESFINAPVADTTVIFENTKGWSSYVPDSYVVNSGADHFASIMLNVPTAAGMRAALDLAAHRNVGYVFVSNRTILPPPNANPYARLPSYWKDEVNYIAELRKPTTRNTIVEVTAKTFASKPHIGVLWKKVGYVQSIGVSRRLKGEATWPAETVLPVTATHFTDRTAQVGVTYEYRVRCTVEELGKSVERFGYVTAAHNLPVVAQRGRVVLLVDNTMITPLATSLTQLTNDLAADGWTVLRHDVARQTVSFDDETPEGKTTRAAEVAAVKSLIVTDYNADPENTRAVFIVGRVPVPFSGVIAPDGHDGSDNAENHIGAWPADVFYSDMDGVWTDTTKNYTDSLPRRHNVPGDGKFDQDTVPGKVELMVGRVDFADITNIPAGKSETDLMAQYLARNHAFRIASGGFYKVPRRALVDDNFFIHQEFDQNSGTYFYEPFANSGWRAGVQWFGSKATNAGKWQTVLPDDSYLLAYGCGGGWYKGASGVADISNFANRDCRAVFTMLFGSFFGEWSVPDNFLRAPLAGTPDSLGLACIWAGRPQYHLPHMALGEVLGYDFRLSQNNTAGDWEQTGFFNQIHTALMGDPTLRLHTFPPVTNVTATASPGSILIKWAPSKDVAAFRYHVFRATSENGPFTQLTGIPATPQKPTGQPITARAWRDKTVTPGQHYIYQIRAVKREVSASGSYYNLSTATAVAVDAAGM